MNTTQNDLLRYLSVDERDEAWGLGVTTIGYQFIPAQGAYPLSRHPDQYNFLPQTGRILNEYQLVYITKGSGFFLSKRDGQPQPVEAGTMMILFPDVWHSYYPNRETGWNEYWVGFKGTHIDRLVKHQFFNPKEPILSIGLSGSLIGLYEEIIRITNEEKVGYQQLIASLVMHLLGTVYYQAKSATLSDPALLDRIHEARFYIKDHLEEDIDSEKVALRIGLSYSYFRRLFKEYTGISPAHYIRQQRLLKAKELLSTTQLTIFEIAYRLQFENPGQFSTCFRASEGISPSGFRKLQGSKGFQS